MAVLCLLCVARLKKIFDAAAVLLLCCACCMFSCMCMLHVSVLSFAQQRWMTHAHDNHHVHKQPQRTYASTSRHITSHITHHTSHHHITSHHIHHIPSHDTTSHGGTYTSYTTPPTSICYRRISRCVVNICSTDCCCALYVCVVCCVCFVCVCVSVCFVCCMYTVLSHRSSHH